MKKYEFAHDAPLPGASRLAKLGVWGCALAALLLIAPTSASAWEIASGFSNNCHEAMAGEVADQTILEAGGQFEAGEQVPLPDSDEWNRLADLLLQDMDIELDNERQKFAMVSLVLGSRYPDTGGDAVTNISSSRDDHVFSSAQEEHCLRREDHNGPKGNKQALEAARANIQKHLDKALSYRDGPPEQQVITRKVFVEYYGDVDIEVWAPAFHAGFALHGFQDCFSHTIRTDDLNEVIHVLNYTDAIKEDYDRDRDGYPHSSAMDQCEGQAEEIADVARQAGGDYLTAFVDEYTGTNPNAMESTLDRWTSYQPGCTVENNLCDSQWLEIAENGQAAPLVELPTCSATGHTDHGPTGFWLLLLAGGALLRLRT